MEVVYVSLGSGCTISQSLREIGLRKQSLPFDWLWNLDSGLDVVNTIIKDNFVQFKDRKNLVLGSHYRWDKKVIINSVYPNIAHVHSDPLHIDEDYGTLLKRINRFKKVLESNGNVQFIYYRLTTEFNLNIQLEEYDVKVCLNKIIKESYEFIDIIKSKYPSLQFKLLSICLIPRNIVAKEKFEIQNFTRQNSEYLDLKIGYAEEEQKVYRKLLNNIVANYSLLNIFYKNKFIGIFYFLSAHIKFSIKSLVRYKMR